eukprot:1004409_1
MLCSDLTTQNFRTALCVSSNHMTGLGSEHEVQRIPNLTGKSCTFPNLFCVRKASTLRICSVNGLRNRRRLWSKFALDETNAMMKLLLCFYDRLSPDNKDKLSLEDCSTDELISIIRLADMVQAPASVLITVAKALSDKELCIESCERMIRLPDHITGCEGFKAIKETVSEYLLLHFHTTCNFDDFCAESLKILLYSEDIVLDYEEEAWVLFIKWWERDKSVNHDSLDDVLKQIRFECFSREYLVAVVSQWPEWYKTSFRKKLLVSIITINRKSYGRLLGLLGLGKCRTNRTEGFGESFFSLSKFKDWLDGSRKFERFIVRSLPMIMSLVVEDNDDVFFVMRLDFDKTALSYVDEDGKTKIGVQISNLSVDGVSVDVNDDFSQVLDFKRSSKLRICIGKKGDLKPESIVKIVVEGV